MHTNHELTLQISNLKKLLNVNIAKYVVLAHLFVKMPQER